ncbi:type II toxin-antitoxin system HicB family antitoxin [archaeon]|nr:MAG: type II toxin-antitoxin system HicB family antitoxin [archaeon]
MSGSGKFQFPVFVEKDEDEIYVAECPILQGCYTQGKTLDEALKNIQEVIELCIEAEREQVLSQMQKIQDFGFHTVAVEV